MPVEGATVVHDAIRGDTRFEHIHLDDPVIARADGSVLYNFAVAIDDLDAVSPTWFAARIISRTLPSSCSCWKPPGRSASALEASPPVYAHLPLLHGPDGKKLSKRHGAASVQELRDAGYLPEAVRNYLALLGWGAGDDQTVLDTKELIERFTLERVSRNPARFDETKLKWLNGVYIRELPLAELTRRLEAFTGRDGLEQAVRISQEKIHTLADFWPLAGFFFDGPTDDPAARERWLGDEGRAAVGDARVSLAELEDFDRDRNRHSSASHRRTPRGQAARGLSATARSDRRQDRLPRHLRERCAARPRADPAPHRPGVGHPADRREPTPSPSIGLGPDFGAGA